MNLQQTFRRLGQQMTGCGYCFKMQSAQMIILKKLYTRNGLEIKMTCPACPEQYEIFKNGKQVAYYRLRHGVFILDFTKCNELEIYRATTIGDGIFEPNERLNYLAKATREVLNNINKQK